MELEWTRDNKYIDCILNPKLGFFKRFLFKRKLKNTLSGLAPSFTDMRKIAECLYFLDTIYLFENDVETTGISGIVKPKRGDYIISTKANSTQTIVITLHEPDMITIEIFNKGKLRSKISFTDGYAEVNDRYDELLFITITNCLMDSFTKVLIKYI